MVFKIGSAFTSTLASILTPTFCDFVSSGAGNLFSGLVSLVSVGLVVVSSVLIGVLVVVVVVVVVWLDSESFFFSSAFKDLYCS